MSWAYLLADELLRVEAVAQALLHGGGVGGVASWVLRLALVTTKRYAFCSCLRTSDVTQGAI